MARVIVLRLGITKSEHRVAVTRLPRCALKGAVVLLELSSGTRSSSAVNLPAELEHARVASAPSNEPSTPHARVMPVAAAVGA